MKKLFCVLLLMLAVALVGCVYEPLEVDLNARNIYPCQDDTYSLGETTTPLRWHNVVATDGIFGSTYVSGSSTTGNLTLSEADYVSVDIPASSMLMIGTHQPVWKVFPPGNVVLAPLFEDIALSANETEIFFTVQVPHGYVEGSDVMFYLHYAYMSDTVGDTAQFGLAYTWANQEALYGADATIYRQLTATNNDKYYHHWVGFPQINGAGKTIGSILVCRIFRNSSDVNDDYADNVALLGVDMICEVDALGSTTRTVK